MQDNMCLFACAVACVHLFVCLSVWSYAAHVRLNAETLQPSAFENPRLYAPHQRYELLCFPYYSSLSSAYEVIEHAPLSFAFTLLCFQCPSMHQCQPPSPQASDLWILSWSVITASRREHWCQICHQENHLMSTNIMNILLTTCGQQHHRFRWYIKRWYIKMLHEILWVISFCWQIIFLASTKAIVNISVAVTTVHALLSV